MQKDLQAVVTVIIMLIASIVMESTAPFVFINSTCSRVQLMIIQNVRKHNLFDNTACLIIHVFLTNAVCNHINSLQSYKQFAIINALVP